MLNKMLRTPLEVEKYKTPITVKYGCVFRSIISSTDIAPL